MALAGRLDPFVKVMMEIHMFLHLEISPVAALSSSGKVIWLSMYRYIFLANCSSRQTEIM